MDRIDAFRWRKATNGYQPAVELSEMEIEVANSPDICASGLGYRKKPPARISRSYNTP